jgi:methylglutaconyl-CoA hydratase
LNSLVLSEKHKDIHILRLNRPDKRNALNLDLIAELKEHINNVQGDDSVRVMVITGVGDAFCAGADLAYLEQVSQFSERENLEDSQSLAVLFKMIYEMPKITVALVNGPAIAGGCGLALTCDYIFADKNRAKFGFSEVRIGFVPAIVMNFLVRKVSPNTAYKLAISAEILSAEQSLKCDLVDDVFLTDHLEEYTLVFLEKLMDQNSFSAMMQTKSLFHKILDLPLEKGLEIASQVNAQIRKTPDCQKGLRLFLKKQKIVWRD